jgi:hypothetical protein
MICKVQKDLDEKEELKLADYDRAQTDELQEEYRVAKFAAQEHRQEHLSNMMSLDCGPACQ